MADKQKVAAVAALTERFCPNKICIRQTAVIDNIRMTAHSTQLHHSALAEYLGIDTLVALKVKPVLRIVLVLCVTPAIT